MEHGEIQIGNTYISGFNDKEYQHISSQEKNAILKGPDGIERPVSYATLLKKYTLKK